MNSRFFYGLFAFTVAFMLGMFANWMINKQYVPTDRQYATCPYQHQINDTANNATMDNASTNSVAPAAKPCSGDTASAQADKADETAPADQNSDNSDSDDQNSDSNNVKPAQPMVEN